MVTWQLWHIHRHWYIRKPWSRSGGQGELRKKCGGRIRGWGGGRGGWGGEWRWPILSDSQTAEITQEKTLVFTSPQWHLPQQWLSSVITTAGYRAELTVTHQTLHRERNWSIPRTQVSEMCGGILTNRSWCSFAYPSMFSPDYLCNLYSWNVIVKWTKKQTVTRALNSLVAAAVVHVKVFCLNNEQIKTI
jgi:hypothetical protein